MRFGNSLKLAAILLATLTTFTAFPAQATMTSPALHYSLEGISTLQQGEVTAAQALRDSVVNDNSSKTDSSTSKLKKKHHHKTSKKKRLSVTKRINSILEATKRSPTRNTVSLSYGSEAILGQAVATKEQSLRYLLAHNPNPKISVSPQEIVDYYYQEAAIEGIRPDVAFAQALKETGFFNYGGTVTPDQNNFSGLGTTSTTVKGAYFPTAQLGVRAHIQHLLAYASVRPPRQEIVDPRYFLVRSAYASTTIDTWPGLNGRWAVPGKNYGQQILQMVNAMLRH